MEILILNVGSSSLKYAVYKDKELVLKGLIEGLYKKSFIKLFKIVKKYNIEAIGHRVVHGFSLTKPCIITKRSLKIIKKGIELAPLHDYPEIKVIELCHELFKVPQVAVFDTDFHSTIPDYASTYAIPKKYRKKYKIKRYGFHGISHEYVYQKAKKILKKPLKKVISCHLGNGCSITAIKNGKSIDTSMGFTPLEGLIMATRSGNIDPSILLYLMKHEKLSAKEMGKILNHESGLLALSERTSKMEKLRKGRNKKSKLAVNSFCYQVAKYIGAYITALNGADAIIFTARLATNSPDIREKILSNFDYLGIKLDKSKNNKNSTIITKPTSKIPVLIIETDEESIIAKETLKLIK